MEKCGNCGTELRELKPDDIGYGSVKYVCDVCGETKSVDFDIEVQKIFKTIIDFGVKKCCVCHHDLDTHIDEGEFWRCHSLGADAYQCECILEKHKANDDISFYDLSRRAKEQMEDLELLNTTESRQYLEVLKKDLGGEKNDNS